MNSAFQQRQPVSFIMPSPVDGLQLHAAEWPVLTNRPLGVVCVVHGMGEHKGRQEAIIRPLRDARFVVFHYDQRGHGQSEGRRGHALKLSDLTRDLEAITAEAARRYPSLPLFVYGHSMGGNVVINYALRHKPRLAGVVLTSPWLRLSFQPPVWKVKLARTVGRLWPTFSQSTGLKPDALYRPGNPYAAPPRDELSHGRITASMFTSVVDGGEWAIAHSYEWKAPLLIVHGTADRITSFEASRQLANNAYRDRCTFIAVEGGYHELHHDLEGPKTMQRITEWLRITT
ncbi:alpha/beta hydrolase [Paenibacillus xylaniclasticus]|uniref:alpha/beta hydrolase n=1 Tax=Paenibacillus xylaniclasticus TaxID=588083 RepID=UPI000FD91882|nr:MULTISPECIES: alpha/beta hydrolase [Paenibacillus]